MSPELINATFLIGLSLHSFTGFWGRIHFLISGRSQPSGSGLSGGIPAIVNNPAVLIGIQTALQ